MSWFDLITSFFVKKPAITVVENGSELYKTVKESMDNFEKQTGAEKLHSLTLAIKHLIMEVQTLKEAVVNQNEVLMNLIMINQRVLGILNHAMAVDEALAEEEMASDDADEEANVAETAEERKIREAAKKFGAN